MPLPAWLAVIEQEPVVSSVTLLPDTVHTVPVVEAKLTLSPELAVAVSVTGLWIRVLSASAPKLMVWLAALIVTA